MKPEIIHAQNLQAGKIVIYGDEVGCFLEVRNGEEGIEVLISMNDLDRLRHAILMNEGKIRAAERQEVPA